MNDVIMIDDDRLDLRRLTAAEELWIWRTRRLGAIGRLFGRSGNGQSQAEAAQNLGISQIAYSRLENGHAVALTAEQMRSLLDSLGPANPTPGETLMVARRRSGLTLTELEGAFGVTRPTFHRFEREADHRLVAFWEARGFRFPER